MDIDRARFLHNHTVLITDNKRAKMIVESGITFDHHCSLIASMMTSGRFQSSASEINQDETKSEHIHSGSSSLVMSLKVLNGD